MPKVKCKYCGKSIDKESSFKEEYLTDSLSIRYRYFCSKECFDKRNEEIVRKQWLKRVKKENREKIRTICGLNEKEKNIYFQSTYKSITDNFSQEDIYEFINKYEKDMLDVLNSKDFKTVNSRVKYSLIYAVSLGIFALQYLHTLYSLIKFDTLSFNHLFQLHNYIVLDITHLVFPF